MKYLGFDVHPSAIECAGGKLLYPGDKVYMLFPAWGAYSFVCEAKVTQVELVLALPNSDKSKWVYIEEDRVVRTYDGLPFEDTNYVIYNHFMDLDEPVGHSVQLNTHDGVYLTLDEALSNAIRWKSVRHHKVRKALWKMRRNRLSFIRGTHRDKFFNAIKDPEVRKEVELFMAQLDDNKKVWVKR